MTSRVLYRVAAVLILLFDLGHSAGFPWSDPKWGVDISAMKTTRFPILGFSRTYWDFYVGFGLFVSVFLLLAALLAWQPNPTPAAVEVAAARMLPRPATWAAVAAALAVFAAH